MHFPNFTFLVCYKFVSMNAFATVPLFLCYNFVMNTIYGKLSKDPKFNYAILVLRVESNYV